MPDRITLLRIGVAFLATLILISPVSAPVSAQDTECGVYGVAVAPQQVGHPLSDDIVRVFGTTGQQLEIPFAQPGNAVPSPRPGTTLLRSMGGIYSLLDIETNTVIPLNIPEREQPHLASSGTTIQNAAVSNHLLLTDDLGTVWLIDLSDGDAANLSSLLPEISPIELAVFAPDGNTLLIYAGAMGYLLYPATTHDVQPITQEAVLPYPGFSSDGSTILFATGEPGAIATIHSYDPTTGTSIELGKSENTVQFEAHLGDPMLILDSEHLGVFPPDGTTTEPLFTWHGTPAGLFTEHSGRFLLIGDEQTEGTSWYRIDIHTGDAQQLYELENMNPLIQSSVQDGIVFYPGDTRTQGTSGAPYRTLDLTTGTIATLLVQDAAQVWSIHPAGDPDGRYAFVNAVSPGFGEMWLIDSRAGTAESVGTSTGNVVASLSPDGCQLAVGIFDTVGEGRKSSVTVTSRVDGSLIATIPDALLIGWSHLQ